MEEQEKDKNKTDKSKEREKLADKIMDIMSNSPEEMDALVELLKSLENNSALHPEKALQKGSGDAKNNPK